MNVVKEIKRLNEHELKFGITGTASWHDKYKDSAYIYIGNLDYELTEGDILTVFSQFGEIIDIHLVRDEETGKSKGFCYLAYEDQRSTILAVDNFNGAKICDRIITVDHKEGYYRKVKKKDGEEEDEEELKKKVHEHPILLKQLRGELPPDIDYISEYETKKYKKRKKKEEKRKRKEEKKRKRKEKEREDKRRRTESPTQETHKEERDRYKESSRRRDRSISPDRDKYDRRRDEDYRRDRYERRER